MISEMILVQPFDTMESITERALKRARDTGSVQRFAFARKLFEAFPAEEGYGTIQMLAELPDEPESTVGARMIISTMAIKMPVDWDWSDVELSLSTGNSVILLAGPDWPRIRVVHDECIDRLGGRVESVNKWRIVRLVNGSAIHFATYDAVERLRGIRFDVAFLEERQKQMGGNYNKFPYRSISADRARWEARQERDVRADAKLANFKKIEADRMAALAAKAEEERNRQQQMVALKPRGIGASTMSLKSVQDAFASASFSEVPALSMSAIGELTKKYYSKVLEEAVPIFKTTANGIAGGMYGGGKIAWPTTAPEDYGTTYTTYGGISRSQNPEGEVFRLRGLLRSVDRILGRHLREQLRAAPSSGSVYASGSGYAITAFEIQQVVQALDSVSGMPEPFWGSGVDLGDPAGDFTAVADDGEKIVLSKDGDRFDSGVLFDPANRPIRKFKLKELAA